MGGQGGNGLTDGPLGESAVAEQVSQVFFQSAHRLQVLWCAWVTVRDASEARDEGGDRVGDVYGCLQAA